MHVLPVLQLHSAVGKAIYGILNEPGREDIRYSPPGFMHQWFLKHWKEGSLVPRPNPHVGKRVWCTSSDFLGFQDAKQSCDINYCHGNALSGMRVAHATTLWPHLRRWCAVT